jgi:hypothetical protein
LRELGGAEVGGAVAPRLRSGLEQLVMAPVVGGAVGALAGGPAGAPLIVLGVRRQGGKGCDQFAEIGGFYAGPGGAACIGQAAVKALLDAAAAKLCCQTLKCPDTCPCQYLPQPKLALYRCGPKEEEGYLLQNATVNNCICFGL